MDFAFTQAQEMLRRSARDFLESNCPTAVVRELEAKGVPYSADLWRRVADMGWLGVALPEEHGGSGDIMDQMVLAEEIGRALLPSPLLTSAVTCGRLLLLAGDPSQRAALLPPLIRGQSVMSLALEEPGARSPLKHPSTTALRHGEGYLINGVKAFVPYASSADVFICAVRSEDPQGITLALVESNSPGVAVTPVKSIANFPQALVKFDNVAVGEEKVLGGAGKGRAPLVEALEWATIVQCGEMVGRGQKILEMVVDYSKSRVQFGRPIGAFQAIQHQCADLQVAVDAARLLTYRAASNLRDGLPSSQEIAMAKAAANEMSRLSTVAGHGIYAGVSYTLEHDMRLYSARNMLAEAGMGAAARHVDAIAGMMGL